MYWCRIPPSFLEGTSSQAVPEFSVSVIENPPIPPQEQLLTTETSLQETSHPYQEQLDHDLDEVPPIRTKRQRPRYSLKGSMLGKHPVLKFSATGPIVSSLYKDPKTICRVFRLLGRGPGLIRDRKFSIWNFLKGIEARRAALYEKMELAYKKSVLRGEGLPLFLDVSTPSVSRSPSTSSSTNSGPNLGRVSLAVSRCEADGAAGSSKKVAPKAAKSKKK